MYNDSIHMTPAGNRFKADIFADMIAPIVAEEMGLPVPPPSEFSVASLPEAQVTEVEIIDVDEVAAGSL
jgi:hypothetical protein